VGTSVRTGVTTKLTSAVVVSVELSTSASAKLRANSLSSSRSRNDVADGMSLAFVTGKSISKVSMDSRKVPSCKNLPLSAMGPPHPTQGELSVTKTKTASRSIKPGLDNAAILFSSSMNSTRPPKILAISPQFVPQMAREKEMVALKLVGENEGNGEPLGELLGESLGKSEGESDGRLDGEPEGYKESVGLVEGLSEGLSEGLILGLSDGPALGEPLGKSLGLLDGESLGLLDGESLGD